MQDKKIVDKGIYSYTLKDGKTYYGVNTTMKSKDKMSIRVTKTGFETKREALKFKEKTRSDYAQMLSYEIGESKNPIENTLDEYLRYKSTRVKETSFKQIKNILTNLIKKYFKDTKIGDIKVKDIADFYEALSNDISNPTTYNMRITVFLDFIKWMDLMTYMSRDIAGKFELMATRKKDIEKHEAFFEVEDISKILKNIEGDRHRLFFTILFYTGMRKGECLALSYDDIDYENGVISVYKQAQERNVVNKSITDTYVILNYTKTNCTKNVVIPQWLVEEIQEFEKNDRTKGFDCIFANHKAFSPGNIKKIFDKACRLAGLEPKKIHATRHTYTTMLLDMGANPKFAAAQLGHSSEKTTLGVYNHINKSRKQQGIDLINSIPKI